jgi:hypothetical protein
MHQFVWRGYSEKIEHEKAIGVLAPVLATGICHKRGKLPRVALHEFPVCSRHRIHNLIFSALRTTLFSSRLHCIIACDSLAEPVHSLAIVKPAIFRTCIRFWNGLASHFRRLHDISVREPPQSHGDDNRSHRTRFPGGSDTHVIPLVCIPVEPRKLAATTQGRGICNLALGHVYLSGRRSRRRRCLGYRRTKRLGGCLASASRRLGSDTTSPLEPLKIYRTIAIGAVKVHRRDRRPTRRQRR